MKSILAVWLLAVCALGAVSLARVWGDTPNLESPGTGVVGTQNAPSDKSLADEGEESNEAAGAVGSQSALIASLTVFVLAIFVGFEIITKVPPTLHTPLMSGSNAISGITIIGAILSAGVLEGSLAKWLGMAAVALAMVNVIGGFMVTNRMLSMFKSKDRGRS